MSARQGGKQEVLDNAMRMLYSTREPNVSETAAYYRYAPHKVTLHLHPAFVTLLQQDLEKAALAQNQFTIYPSTLLQLATLTLAEIKGESHG